MEKATYSLSALKQCKEFIRKNRWSTRLKAEHNSRCAEVNVLFASCQKLLNYVMFQPDLSPAYDYQQMVLSKNCTKKTTRQSASCLPRACRKTDYSYRRYALRNFYRIELLPLTRQNFQSLVHLMVGSDSIQ